MNERKKFYKKGWFTGLMLLLFFPVGIVLLWKYHNKRKVINVVLSLVFGFIFISVIGGMLADDGTPQTVSQNQQTQQSQVTDSNKDVSHPDESIRTEYVEPHTSGEELRTLFVGYLNSANDSTKNRLTNENPKELYDVVISLLEYIPQDPGRGKIDVQTVLDNNILENIVRVCDAYLDIFSTATESEEIKQLRESAEQLAEKNSLIEKYESDNGNLLIDESEGVYSMSFYIKNALGITAGSSIDKFLLDLGVYGSDIPQSYGGTIGYEEAFGTYLPGNERCVVQPLSEYTFSQAGVYTLNVINGGEMEVVDTQGFKSFVPLYVEVSNEFVEQFSTDRYSFYDVDYDTLEQSIKNLILSN